MKNIPNIEKLLYLLILLICVGGIYVSFVHGHATFNEQYAPEDGLIEYGTFIFLLLTALLMFLTLFKYRSAKSWYWILGTLLIAHVFIFAAGEEISWGQRIFGFETNESFSDINKQGETNLHNIVIGDLDVNKLIFSKLLTFSLIIYLLIIPFFINRWLWLKDTLDKFGIPIPYWRQTIAFIIMAVLPNLIGADKKWEILELGFSIIIFIIFLYPQNAKRIRS